jgi:hypothetical protein
MSVTKNDNRSRFAACVRAPSAPQAARAHRRARARRRGLAKKKGGRGRRQDIDGGQSAIGDHPALLNLSRAARVAPCSAGQPRAKARGAPLRFAPAGDSASARCCSGLVGTKGVTSRRATRGLRHACGASNKGQRKEESRQMQAVSHVGHTYPLMLL